MSLLTEHFNNVVDAQLLASRLVSAGTQFTFSQRDGVLSISYPNLDRVITPRQRTPAAPPPAPEAA